MVQIKSKVSIAQKLFRMQEEFSELVNNNEYLRREIYSLNSSSRPISPEQNNFKQELKPIKLTLLSLSQEILSLKTIVENITEKRNNTIEYLDPEIIKRLNLESKSVKMIQSYWKLYHNVSNKTYHNVASLTDLNCKDIDISLLKYLTNRKRNKVRKERRRNKSKDEAVAADNSPKPTIEPIDEDEEAKDESENGSGSGYLSNSWNKEKFLEISLDTPPKYITCGGNPSKKNKLIFSLEGTIGVGKSCGIKWLKEKFALDSRIYFVDEPVDLWIRTGFLDKMYKGELTSLESQFFVLTTRFAKLIPALYDSQVQLIITERSMHSDLNVFAKVTLKTDTALETYKVAHAELHSTVPTSILEMNVWLDASPENIRARINKRGRPEESEISDEYLASLKDAHQVWFDSLPDKDKIIIDCDKNSESVGQILESLINSALCI